MIYTIVVVLIVLFLIGYLRFRKSQQPRHRSLEGESL